MKSYNFSFFGLFAGLIFTALIFVSYSASDENASEKESIHLLPQKVRSPKLPANLTFAGEEIPINMDTRERIDRELLVNAYWQSSTLLNIKMAKKYFPVIEKVLAENNVPDDFKYLAVAESNLRNVTSPAAAKGFWQFRKLAAKEFDLEVNSEVDERYHLEKSTEAAAKYLKQLHKRFGNWSNAAAAYNMGPTNFSRSLKSQKEDSYFDMNINEETGRYLFRMVALKEIMKNPDKYGFYLEEEDYYEPLGEVYKIKIDKSVPSWADFAKENNVSYRTLKYYNPWLVGSKLTVRKNTYYVSLPKK